jgi:hypothetical protein
MPRNATLQHQLFTAISNNASIEHLAELQQLGASLNEADPAGNTSLHLAARLEQTTILAWLISQGCTLISLNKLQQIPLHVAAQYNQTDTALAILNPLKQRLSSTQLAKLLNHADSYGKTLLSHACEQGNRQLIQTFLACGAEANLTNKNGQTAFSIGLSQNARGSLTLLAAQYPVNWQLAEQSEFAKTLAKVKQALLQDDYADSTYKLDSLRRGAEAIACLPLQSFCLAQQAILELGKVHKLAKTAPQIITTAAELKKQHQAYQHYVKAAMYINGAHAYYQLQAKQTTHLTDFLPANYDQYLTDHLYVIEACMLQELFHTKYRENFSSHQNLAEHLHYNNIPAHRKSLADHLCHVDSLLEAEEDIANILLENTRKAKAIFIQMLYEALEVLGPPPCEYAIKFVGSWERREMSLCSDIEWFILIEREPPETLAYFRKLSQLVHLKFINLGQTPLHLQTQSPNRELQKAIKSKPLSPTPQGIRIDESYLTPLGNPEWPFALIGTPETLLKFQQPHWETLAELQYALRAISLDDASSLLSTHGAKLLANYQTLLAKHLNSQASNKQPSQRQAQALKLLEQHIYDDYPLRLTSIAEGGALNVKNDLYRPLSMLISDLALYHGIAETNTWDCLKELYRQGYLSQSIKQSLVEALNSAVQFRIFAQRHYGTEHEMLWHRQTPEQDTIVPYLAELKPNFILNEQHLQQLTDIYQVLLPVYELARQFIQTQGKTNDFATHQLVLTNPIGQYLAQGLTLEAVGNHNEAFKAYSAGLGINPSAPELLLRSAICMAELHRRSDKTLDFTNETLKYLQQLIEPLLVKAAPAAEFLPYYRNLPGFLRDEFRQLLLPYEVKYKQVSKILRVLNQYPEKTGKRHAVLLEEQQWRNTLQTLTTDCDGAPNSVVLESPLLGRCEIKPEIVKQLFDKKRNFRRNKINASQHDVIPIAVEGKKLYLKKDPEMPGMTYFIEQMHQRIIGHGTSRSELAKLVVGNKIIPVLISEEVPGENLHDVLLNSPEKLQRLDHKSICELVLLALLTYPEDGKASNYILTALGENYTLKSVDHDHAMFPAMDFISILLCLDNMLQKIHPEARQLFVEIDPDVLLRSLFFEAQQKNQQYAQLFGDKLIQEMYKNSKKGCTTIPIPLKKGDGLLLRERFSRLQQLLKDNPAFTLMDLLRELEPRIAQKYHQTFKQHTCPHKRFNAAVGKRYKQTNGYHVTSTSAKTSLQIDRTILLGASYLQLDDLDPAKILAELDEGIYVQSILGKVLEKFQQGDVTSFNTLQTISNKEFVVNGSSTQAGLDFQKMTDSLGKPDLAKQKTVLDAIIAKTPYQHLKLRHCQALNRQNLLKLLEAVPDIIELDLSYCHELSDKEIISIAKRCPTLRRLHLQGCSQLINLKGHFPALEYLNLSDCKRLVEVDVKTAKLQTLQAKSCTRLKGIKTRSKYLKNADLTLCRSLINVTYLTQNFQRLEHYTHTDGRARVDSESELSSQSETAGWIQLLKDCSCQIAETIDLNRYFRFNPKEDLAVLQSMVQKASKLKKLQFGNKKYTASDMEILLNALNDKIDLIELDLSYCELNDKSLAILATIISNNPKLKLLNLSRCQLDAQRLSLITSTLQQHKNLDTLFLDNNRLGIEGVQLLIPVLQQNYIKNLDLAYNELGAQGIKVLKAIMLSKLIKLNLAGNEINATGIETIITNLATNTSLEELDISCNADLRQEHQHKLDQLLARNKKQANASLSALTSTHYSPVCYLNGLSNRLSKNPSSEQIADQSSQQTVDELTENSIMLTL